METAKLDFGSALKLVKEGKKVARAGWNGKDMFIYFVPANEYEAQTEVARKTFGEKVPYGAYLAMKTAENVVVPYVASQTCILAEDWYEVVDPAGDGQTAEKSA